ncbi:MAG TPA: sterol desaturase family protein [Chitinophagaceae bacterium]|nr:sterol desaturase family protein [Chitinophagaceae bacterium]
MLPDLSHPVWFCLTTLLFFIAVVGRYFLFAGAFQLIFYSWPGDKWRKRKLGKKPYRPQQFRKEVGWSMLTAAIFAIAGAATALLWQKGYTKIYTPIDQYGWLYLPVSLIISMLLHETYYYWLHRWMHHPSIFKIVHKVHHESNITSPWTAFSFHPLEGLLQAIILPAILMVVPMHPYVILVQLTLMTFSSVINHLDIEIYPKKFHKHALGRWFIGATHHALHHRQFRYNYGLYFTVWDKWKSTESPLYEETFEKVTEGDH